VSSSLIEYLRSEIVRQFAAQQEPSQSLDLSAELRAWREWRFVSFDCWPDKRSYHALATRMHMDSSVIELWANGRRLVPAARIPALATALGISIEELLIGTVETRPQLETDPLPLPLPVAVPPPVVAAPAEPVPVARPVPLLPGSPPPPALPSAYVSAGALANDNALPRHVPRGVPEWTPSTGELGPAWQQPRPPLLSCRDCYRKWHPGTFRTHFDDGRCLAVDRWPRAEPVKRAG
jgi:transcriptional regulator with XRE-family HTH domain